MATRTLYLTRHAEATDDEVELTKDGRRQAELLGQRLRGVPFAAVHHGPLNRAAQTARLVCAGMGRGEARANTAAGDYVPYVPDRAELPAESADLYLGFLDQFDTAEGPALAQAALDQFTGPAGEDRHELVVTHNFLIAWLVRAAVGAPPWRWLGLNHCHAALTVIRYASGLPAAVLVFNDMSHLPPQLRWTGFPADAPWRV
ncbi:histidine phosphatase family protein [Actinokineospora sp. HUAS TT18]|uniref:histidine phosphatase family protein n=1 Tax=Actinokineospora sp. HUAS TT18 TaxID=3447451 RepID=UPI003F52409C